MDHPSLPTALPTAAELGVSDGEYERILRDLHQRHGIGQPIAAPRPQQRRPMRLPLVVLALIVAVVLLFRLPGGGDSEAYAFTETVDGKPVTYTSCRVIQVAVYPAGGPPNAEELVRQAVARLRSATGLDIVVVGAFGGHAPNWNFEAGPVHPDDPISVSWQDGAAIASLTDHVAGLGGSRVMTSPAGTRSLVAGTIALSRDYYALLHERGDHAEALAVLLHEFGHVFGLGHVDSESEVMDADNSAVSTFGSGDLKGLRLLGQGPCT